MLLLLCIFMTCQASLCQDPHCQGFEADILYTASGLGWLRLLCGLANYMCHLQFAITVEIQDDYWSSRGIQTCYNYIICIFGSQCLCALEIIEIRSHLVCFQNGRKLTEIDRWNALSFKMGHMDLAAD